MKILTLQLLAAAFFFTAVPALGATAADQALDSLGYFQAHWDSTSTPPVLDKGPRATLTQITFTSPLIQNSLDSLVAARNLPRPYDAAFIAATIKTALELCAQQGHPFVYAASELSQNDTLCTIHITLTTSGPMRMSRALFSPPPRTKASQLGCDIMFSRGALYDSRAIQRTVERLRSRDYINDIQAAPPLIDTLAPCSAPLDSCREGIAQPFIITENSGLNLEGALGFDADKGASRLVGSLDFSLLNRLGFGEEAAVHFRGAEDASRLELSLAKSFIGRLPLFPSGDFTFEVKPGVYGYTGGRITTLIEPALRWKFGLGLLGHETTQDDTLAERVRYGGITLIVRYDGVLPKKGVRTGSFLLETGGGLADNGTKKSRRFTTNALLFGHLPLGKSFGYRQTIGAATLQSDEATLSPAELSRVGGVTTIRGYSEEAFTFRSVVWSRTSVLWYIGSETALFLLADAGAGLGTTTESTTPPQILFGYGMGISLPTPAGTLSLEWARNRDDIKSLGRLHIRLGGSFANRK